MGGRFRCERVSWAAVQRLARKLAADIRADRFNPQAIVAIGRGGYVPARLLCDHLDLSDLRSIRIAHYTAGAEKQRRARLVDGLCRDLGGRRVLLVDDAAAAALRPADSPLAGGRGTGDAGVSGAGAL